MHNVKHTVMQYCWLTFYWTNLYENLVFKTFLAQHNCTDQVLLLADSTAAVLLFYIKEALSPL